MPKQAKISFKSESAPLPRCKKDLTEQLNIIEFLPLIKIALHNFKAEYELKNNGIRGE